MSALIEKYDLEVTSSFCDLGLSASTLSLVTAHISQQFCIKNYLIEV